jgi:hypothetical protein
MRRLIALLRALFRRRCPHKTLGWPRYVVRSVVNLLFGCRHARVTFVFSDDAGLYQRCLDCGARLKPSVDLKPNSRVLVRIEERSREKQSA